MIDPETGHLHIREGVIITPEDDYETVKAYAIGERQLCEGWPGEGWWHLIERHVHIEHEYYRIHFYFGPYRKRHLMTSVEISVGPDPMPLEYIGWEHWSQEREMKKLAYYKDWIMRTLGHEGEFSWGSIDACYDDKSGSSKMTILYPAKHKVMKEQRAQYNLIPK